VSTPRGGSRISAPPNAGVFGLTHPTGVVGSVSDQGSRWDLKYDGSGRLAKVKGPSGTTSLSYNAAARVSRIVFDDGSRQNFGYNATGRITSFSDSGGDTGAFTYDSSGRLTNSSPT
jgi:YD repeat-containing protein